MKKHSLLFIIDPLEKLLPNDTTFIIMAEAYRRGHAVWTATIADLSMENGLPKATVTRIAPLLKPKMNWKIFETAKKPLEYFPLIFMRKDPPFNIDYVLTTSLLSEVDSSKTRVINSPEALRSFNEKLGIFQFPKYIPSTIVTKHATDVSEFLKKHKKIVLKPLHSYGGKGIIVLDHTDKNKNSLLELLTHHETEYLMAQQYLPAVKNGDKRVLILNGKILGQHNRIAAPEDHRSNTSAGGMSHPATLTVPERRMCEQVGAALRTQGIYFAGLDLIGGYITEINITSPTGLVEINKHENAHIEREVVDFFESKI